MKFSAVMKKTLRDLLVERAIRIAGPGKWFTLSTGKKSKYYVNSKPVTFSSEGAPLIAEAFLDKLDEFQEPVTAVGGRTLGADPIVMSMVMSAPLRGRHLEGFIVRDKQKSHGTLELIANVPPPGTSVVIVDDVITTGKSVMEAVTAVREAGCKVVGVIALMDRLEENGEANIRAQVPTYYAIYTRRDFPEIADAERLDLTETTSKMSA